MQIGFIAGIVGLDLEGGHQHARHRGDGLRCDLEA
jgi:hypothetical protein